MSNYKFKYEYNYIPSRTVKLEYDGEYININCNSLGIRKRVHNSELAKTMSHIVTNNPNYVIKYKFYNTLYKT